MHVIRVGVLAKRTGPLIVSLALLVACGRVTSSETDSAGADSAGGGFGGSDATAHGGSSHAGLAGAAPSAGADSAGLGGAPGNPEDAGAAGELAGAAGDSAETELPLPADCQAHGYSATDSTCLLRTTCHGATESTACDRVAPDTWQCGCGSAHPERKLELSGASGLKACAFAAGLCASEKLDLSTEVCTGNPDYPNPDRCGLDLTCRNHVAADLPAGVEVDLVRSGRVICGAEALPDDAGQRPFSCFCLIGGNRKPYTTLSDASDRACRSTLDVCLSIDPPSFTAPSACTANVEVAPSNESGASGCSELQLCGPRLALSVDAALVDVSERREFSCTSLQGGGASCTCALRHPDGSGSLSTTGYGFRVAQDLSSTSCDPALCGPDVSVEATGTPGACESNSETVNANTCSSFFDCPVPASLAGRPVVALAPLGVACAERASDHSWWCSCRSDTATAKFELGSAASSEEACQLAPARCLTQISLQLGPPQGSLWEPPNPLP